MLCVFLLHDLVQSLQHITKKKMGYNMEISQIYDKKNRNYEIWSKTY